MDTGQKRTVLALMGLAILCWLGSPLLAGRGSPAWPAEPPALSFDGNRASEIARSFVTRYPQRVMGSIESRQASGFFKEQLAPLGYEIQYTHFDATIDSLRQVGRNVFALKPGQSDETVAVLAQYDTARSAAEGGSGNGSGIAVFLELARVFAAETPRRSILFIASDGREWGALGALDITQNRPSGKRLAAVIALDDVGGGSTSHLRIDATGLGSGYSPPWLRLLAREAAEGEGFAVWERNGWSEHLDRAFLVAGGAQGPFLEAGFPAISLCDQPADRAYGQSVLHFPVDATAEVDPATLQRYGRAAERILRRLDGLAAFPPGPTEGFQVVRGRYLAPLAVTALHLLTFLPFVVLFIHQWNRYSRDFSVELFQRELIGVMGAWIPLVTLYGGVILFWRMGMLPWFTLYPPPPKDPAMEQPAWGVLAGIGALGLCAGVILFFLGKVMTRKLPRSGYYPAKVFLLMLLSVVLALAYWHNAYWAVSFFLLPALVWGMVGPGVTRRARAANRLLILAAALPCFLVFLGESHTAGLGWKILWFQAIALGTGLFSLGGFLLTTAAAAIGIRFLAIQNLWNR